MRTSKPISTISYNTDAYLQNVLNDMLSAKKISFWAYIKHLPEEDETKEHKHVYIEPNTKIDTMEFQEMTKEIDITKEGKYLKCIDCRSSKWDDWYYYAIHNVEYLLMKLEVKRYQYKDSEIVSCDDDELEVRIQRARHSDVMQQQKLHNCLRNGLTISQMTYRGMLNPNKIFAYTIFENKYKEGEYLEQNYYEWEDLTEKDKRDICKKTDYTKGQK